MSRGVFLGTITPTQKSKSESGNPASSVVGTSGRADVRFELLRPTQLAELSAFWHERRYRSLAAPYRVFAVERSRGTAPWSGKARTAFAGAGFVVLVRP